MMPSRRIPEVSVIVSVGNAEDVIGSGTRRVVEHLREQGRPFEVLGINAGSWDTSFKVLRLLAAEVPELRLIEKDLQGRAFIRGVCEARGHTVILMDAARMPRSLSPLGWTLSRLERGTEAVVVRGRFITARRLAALPVIARTRGLTDAFERSFEREARDLVVEVVGTAPRPPFRLLAPVWRLLAI
jgi:hypothetical protein